MPQKKKEAIQSAPTPEHPTVVEQPPAPQPQQPPEPTPAIRGTLSVTLVEQNGQVGCIPTMSGKLKIHEAMAMVEFLNKYVQSLEIGAPPQPTQ